MEAHKIIESLLAISLRKTLSITIREKSLSITKLGILVANSKTIATDSKYSSILAHAGAQGLTPINNITKISQIYQMAPFVSTFVVVTSF